MGLFELFLTSIALSMDAFAVAICLGLSMEKIKLSKMVIVGLYFGIFQAAMPLIGYFVGIQFADRIVAFDHWLAFALLAFIGGRMVKGSFDKDEEEEPTQTSLKPKDMLPLALATSIDAMAVGVSLAFLDNNNGIAPAVLFIGIVTFTLSAVGVKIGGVFGKRFKSKAELVGGIILILIGLKILIEHLFIPA